MSGIQIHNFSGDRHIGSGKSNYNTSTTTAASIYSHGLAQSRLTILKEVYSIQHYVISFVSDLGQVNGWSTPVSSTATIKLK
jgi:hypothetical protein